MKLQSISTKAPKDLDKATTREQTNSILNELQDLQNVLYAQSKYSVLIILQGMDASGKDGIIRNVFSHLNPQGVQVHSFKVPGTEELSHDFLWRIHLHTPAKGMIQIFNRSHYEDVLITRLYKMIDDATALERMKAINNFEDLLVKHNNTQILKFYLHVSKEKQSERLEERLHDKTKMWKYNEKDTQEAKRYDDYLPLYEECFEKCNAIPWTITPADQNWYKEYVVASELLKTLKTLPLEYPHIKTEDSK